MATSQNGWSAITSSSSSSLVDFPWVTGQTRKGDVHVIFNDLAKWFDANVEDIRVSWSWGWNYRNVRGSATSLSNHSSATAIDLNAPLHPQKAQGSAWTFTVAQRAKILAKMKSYGGVVRWGGIYTIGKRDEMHFEIVGTPAQVKALAKKIKGGKVATPVPVKTAAAKKPAASKKLYAELKVDGIKGKSTIKAWQTLLKAHGYYNRAIDGDFGYHTVVAMQKWLRHVGCYPASKYVVDGKWGKASVKALQSFLKKQGTLDAKKWMTDGDEGRETVKAEQRWLNTKN